MSAPAREPASLGTCFGYEVRSALPFRYLRGGTGEQPLVVEEAPAPVGEPGAAPVLTWQPPDQPYRARLHEVAGGYRLWIDGTGWFGVYPREGRIEVPPGGDPVRREERVWGLPALLCFLRRGDLPLHAAAVDVGGAALLLAGPRMFGKTTLAAAFAAAGYRVLAEDLSCLRADPIPSVVPGPAMLRVRPDVAGDLDVEPGAASSSDDRVHVALDRERRGDCAPVPVRAVVFLRPADEGISLEEIDPAEALPDVWALSFKLPTDEDRTRAFASITRLLDVVPALNLRRPVQIGALSDALEVLTAIGEPRRAG